MMDMGGMGGGKKGGHGGHGGGGFPPPKRKGPPVAPEAPSGMMGGGDSEGMGDMDMMGEEPVEPVGPNVSIAQDPAFLAAVQAAVKQAMAAILGPGKGGSPRGGGSSGMGHGGH